MQCCACSKWVYLRCSQLSFSKFRILDSSHSWSCSLCCVPTHNTVTSASHSSNTYISTVQSSPSSANTALPPHPRLQTSYPRQPIQYILPLPLTTVLAPGCPSMPPASSTPDFLRVLLWNAGGLRARSTELLHFLLTPLVDLICIQESNLNSSSSSRILCSAF